MKIRLVILIVLLCSSSILHALEQPDKSTKNLKQILSSLSPSSDSSVALWVTFDEQKIKKVAVELTKKSIQRRGKVDNVTYLVDKYDSTFSSEVIDSLVNVGAEIRHILYWFDAITINLPASQIQKLAEIKFVKSIDVVKQLQSDRVFQVEPVEDMKNSAHYSTSLPYGFSEAQNRYVRADKLHDAGLSGKGVRIAIFDSGFNTNHRAFDSLNIINTYNFIDSTADVTLDDCNTSLSQARHGTMTLGVVGGYVPDTLIGVAYNAEFLLAKTEITCGEVEIKQEEDNWIVAAQWADQLGADIISSSLGYATFQDTTGYNYEDLDGVTPRITVAAEIAFSKNILVVNSAGNERGSSWNHILTPADGNNVIAVGATNLDSSLASFSSPGPTADGRIKPDISTLGTSVATAYYTGGYTTGASGTSFSAPLVAGCIALALEHDSTLTAIDLVNLIRESGNMQDNPNNDFGYGLFDAVKTADIIQFKKPFSFSLSYLGVNRFLIETAGRSSVIPILSLLDSNTSLDFQDNHDGTGFLVVDFSTLSSSVVTFHLTADVGYFVDTTEFTVVSEGLIQDKLVVGPNPFKDYLNLYFYDAENFESLTIHAVSGEKVWELFNNFQLDADINRIEARWNCTNLSGEVVADGIYIVVVTAGGKQFYHKVLKIE